MKLTITILGNPKGVVRDNGGHAVALKWSLSNIFDIQPGDVWWAASDIGWVVGHSYIVYGPLLQGATSIMYEGKPVGTPDVSVAADLTLTRVKHKGYNRVTSFKSIFDASSV
jgi:acyl-coenzyme A synthetase/AMP-(fatty) acid ligase